jgi:hypothetical protein
MLSLLEQRKIEANVLVPFITAFAARYGEKEVRKMVRGVIAEAAFKQGAEIARQGGEPLDNMKSLIPKFCEGGGIELTIVQDTADAFDFDVTRCRYAEFYKEMGASEIGYCLSCHRDFALANGISRNLKLIRTQTIMQGGQFCDFRFRLRKQEPAK